MRQARAEDIVNGKLWKFAYGWSKVEQPAVRLFP